MPNKTIKLTKKQKAFADKLLSSPKISGTKAILDTYGKPDKPVSYKTASVMASENLGKPSIILYLENHKQLAQETIIEVLKTSTELRDNPKHAEIALKASDMILDRTLGKPTTRLESTIQGDIKISFGGVTVERTVTPHDTIAEGEIVEPTPPPKA